MWPHVPACARMWPHMAAFGRTWPHMPAYGRTWPIRDGLRWGRGGPPKRGADGGQRGANRHSDKKSYFKEKKRGNANPRHQNNYDWVI